MKDGLRIFLFGLTILIMSGCYLGGEVVSVTEVSGGKIEGLGEKDLARLEEIRKAQQGKNEDLQLKKVIQTTPNYTVEEYLAAYAENALEKKIDYRVGGFDVLDIIVYEEPDLSRKSVRVSADGYISFPFIGRVLVDGLTPAEIEQTISRKLSEGQYILNAHVAVNVVDYLSRKYMVLGAIGGAGMYPLQAKERMLDAISKAGGVDINNTSYEAMIIRDVSETPDQEKKIVIHVDLLALLKKGDPVQNLPVMDGDLIYVPNPEYFYMIGQVGKAGAFTFRGDITLVEAIGMAGGFTQIAARNRTRIIRVDDGVEKIIYVKVDAITDAGKRTQDVKILPGDIIIVPESFF